jgi:hypothetical protein
MQENRLKIVKQKYYTFETTVVRICLLSCLFSSISSDFRIFILTWVGHWLMTKSLKEARSLARIDSVDGGTRSDDSC